MGHVVLLASTLMLSGCFQASHNTPPEPRQDASASAETELSQTRDIGSIYLPELCSQGERAQVVKIVDGDTIDVRFPDSSEERVRYIGIDTPELGEACSTEATQRNRELVDNQEVLLIRDVSDRGIYGRLVRYVCLTTGQFIDAQLVAEGYAHAYRYYPDTGYADYLSALETEAISDGRGCLHDTAVDAYDASDTACCKICRSSQPCGDSCISWNQQCDREPGCACGG